MTDFGENEKIEAVAIEAARVAGELLLRHFESDLTVDAIQGRDVKLEVDRLAEEAIKAAIEKHFDDHTILGEEGGQTSEARSDYLWVVDPLDGTVNYYHGLPYYCTSIACYRTSEDSNAHDSILPGLGKPVVGVVYAPPTDELFVGVPGRGASLNGREISVAPADDLTDTVFATGFGKTLERAREMARVTAGAAETVRKVRCLGAAAYDICNVAAGRLGAFFENSLRTWDIAAGAVVLTAAGGVIDAEEIRPSWWRFLATTPALKPRLQSIVN